MVVVVAAPGAVPALVNPNDTVPVFDPRERLHARTARASPSNAKLALTRSDGIPVLGAASIPNVLDFASSTTARPRKCASTIVARDEPNVIICRLVFLASHIVDLSKCHEARRGGRRRGRGDGRGARALAGLRGGGADRTR